MMNHGTDIPVETGITSDVATAPARQVDAILHELAKMLENLVHQGETASIDIRSLPLSPHDHEELRNQLGTGEVRVNIQALGPSLIEETAISGIWWITHFNAHDEKVAELIEVTPLPEIIQPQDTDLLDGLNRLTRLTQA